MSLAGKVIANDIVLSRRDHLAGINLLDAAIKSQREETQKQLDSLRAASTAAQSEVKAQEKIRVEAEAAAKQAQESGAIDLTLTFKADPKPVSIQLDDSVVSADFIGTAWSSGKLAPGMYKLVVRELGETKFESQGSISVEAGKVAKAEMKLSF